MTIDKAAIHLDETIEALQDVKFKELSQTIEVLKQARLFRRLVFTFGNGGSHSTASHFANDLLKVCGIRAICISDMIPTILAYNNDNSHVSMFALPANQLAKQLHEVHLIGFSCSGNSKNVIAALGYPSGTTYRNERILFTGNQGGEAQNYADIVLRVSNPNIRIQESVHLALCHTIVEVLADG